MIVDAKCNIISLALKKFNELSWQTKFKNLDNQIISDYAQSLNCFNIDGCYSADDYVCDNPTIVFQCSLKVNKISKIVNENTVTFYIDNVDFVAGLPPYNYHWTYEADDFDNSGPIDVDKSILTVKEGKDINLLVTSVSVTVTDANGCKTIRNCYMTPDGMQCADNYVACLNVTGLKVINKTINCVGPSGLIVNKK